jgi:hypothetical protein
MFFIFLISFAIIYFKFADFSDDIIAVEYNFLKSENNNN